MKPWRPVFDCSKCTKIRNL